VTAQHQDVVLPEVAHPSRPVVGVACIDVIAPGSSVCGRDGQ
jgi:hypothetical protein